MLRHHEEVGAEEERPEMPVTGIVVRESEREQLDVVAEAVSSASSRRAASIGDSPPSPPPATPCQYPASDRRKRA